MCRRSIFLLLISVAHDMYPQVSRTCSIRYFLHISHRIGLHDKHNHKSLTERYPEGSITCGATPLGDYDVGGRSQRFVSTRLTDSNSDLRFALGLRPPVYFEPKYVPTPHSLFISDHSLSIERFGKSRVPRSRLAPSASPPSTKFRRVED